MKKQVLLAVLAVLVFGGLAIVLHSCKGGKQVAKSDIEQAALATYVPPGDLDKYYLFLSGGHSGNVYVYGMPSMRHIRTIPVFTPYPVIGYGFDTPTKKMLGEYTWGDVHHPQISKTDGDYDGRWLFVNDNANNRVARIDLGNFITAQIYGPIPNLMGNHGSAFVTNSTEYILVATRFSVPIPVGSYAPMEQYKTNFHGVVGAVAVDPQSGNMSLGWEVMMPPFDYDLGIAGKGPSKDWAFWSCYNSERATGVLEITASQNDRDYIAAVNWRKAEEAAKAGNVKMIGGAKVIDPAATPGIVYLLPCAKSPHGADVTPDGQWIIGSGKLQSITTVFNFDKMLKAIDNKDFIGNEDNIPVLKYESIMEAEVPVGLGPLHTQFDGKGFAYTSLFVESAIAKWQLGTWQVVDKIPVTYNVGHLCIPGGDTRHPYGEYLVSLNKLSHGTHLPVGPSQPECEQLIDIGGDKMKLLYDTFVEPEPHYAVAIPADKIKSYEVFRKGIENTDPNAIWDEKDAGVTRSGNTVTVKMTAIRSHFMPWKVEVNQGDNVRIYLTNIEQTTDETHGFAICNYNIDITVDPGETKLVEFRADKPGVYPFYCTNFCSALHQEMQGYLLVKAKG